MLFSVVTVTLNCANDAVTTAESVLSQNYSNYEYIVKDGCSSDGTVERLLKIGASVHVKNDVGIYDAMNQAINLCQGKYIYFLNAGDTFYSSTTLSQLATSITSDKDIYYGNICLLPMIKIRRHPLILSRFYLFRKNLNHQAWIAKKELYDELNKFNINYKYMADQEFLCRALFKYNKNIEYIDLIFSNFVYGGASTKKTVRKDIVLERRFLLRQFYSPWEFIIYGLLGLYFLNPLKYFIWYKYHFNKLI